VLVRRRSLQATQGAIFDDIHLQQQAVAIETDDDVDNEFLN